MASTTLGCTVHLRARRTVGRFGNLRYSRLGSLRYFVITANSGLISTDTCLDLKALSSFCDVPIDHRDQRYRMPLERDLQQLAAVDCDVVLLGSISTNKYVEALLACLGRERVYFPSDFVGRGDMSRGGLMLRCVRQGRELGYARLADAVRRGPRPPKLEPIRSGRRVRKKQGPARRIPTP